MQSNASCPDGWTRSSELSSLNDCEIPIVADLSLKGIGVSLGFVFLLGELITLLVRLGSLQTKGKTNWILMIWAIVQNPIMILRPGFGLLLGVRSQSSLWLSFITHISGATAAGIVILFIYLQLGIIHRSSMKQETGLLFKQKKTILITIGLVQALFFLIGPLVAFYTSVPLYQMFWGPVVAIDFTVIPYFCYLTGLIWAKIRQMIRDDFKKLSRQILITGMICSGIGLFTGGVGIYSLIQNRYEWVLIEICWISDIIFNGIIFGVLVRRRSRQPKRKAPTEITLQSE